MFWSVPGREETSSSGTSFLNVAEADAVEAVVTCLLRAGGAKPEEVGVITPYEGQRARVRHALSTRGPLSQAIYDAVEVASVDGFQGREKEFIVFSAVRTGGLATAPPNGLCRGGGTGGGPGGPSPPQSSGAAAGIGFLADPRRLNVALTRARSGVVLVGSPEPLSRHALWAALLARVSAAGAIVEGPLAALRPAAAPVAATRGVDAGEKFFFFCFFSSFDLAFFLFLFFSFFFSLSFFSPSSSSSFLSEINQTPMPISKQRGGPCPAPSARPPGPHKPPPSRPPRSRPRRTRRRWPPRPPRSSFTGARCCSLRLNSSSSSSSNSSISTTLGSLTAEGRRLLRSADGGSGAEVEAAAEGLSRSAPGLTRTFEVKKKKKEKRKKRKTSLCLPLSSFSICNSLWTVSCI